MKFSQFFSDVQEAPWYRQFLLPVISEVDNGATLLDIGTGPGKLLELLSTEKGVNCTGLDTNQPMLDEAKKKLAGLPIQLVRSKQGEPLPFANTSFDYISFCSVLFLLEKKQTWALLDEAKRVLTHNGKIIVLTPTGNGNIFLLIRHFFSSKNLSIYLWFNSTRLKAKHWQRSNPLAEYSHLNNLKYTCKKVFMGLAQMEVLSI